MNTLYVCAEGVLPQIKGNLTIMNENSSRLLSSLVNSFPLPSISKCRPIYEADFTVSVVSFVSSSLGVNAMHQITEIMDCLKIIRMYG